MDSENAFEVWILCWKIAYGFGLDLSEI